MTGEVLTMTRERFTTMGEILKMTGELPTMTRASGWDNGVGPG
jgi:hypothetical protein